MHQQYECAILNLDILRLYVTFKKVTMYDRHQMHLPNKTKQEN